MTAQKILLKLQVLANQIQSAAEGKIQCHVECPEGGEINIEQFKQIKPPGRLIINTEVYPAMKRACLTLEAIHQTRLKEMQARGIEHKAHMDAYEKESKEGKRTRYMED